VRKGGLSHHFKKACVTEVRRNGGRSGRNGLKGTEGKTLFGENLRGPSFDVTLEEGTSEAMKPKPGGSHLNQAQSAGEGLWGHGAGRRKAGGGARGSGWGGAPYGVGG